MSRHEFILRFTLAHPACHTTIVGTTSLDHMRSNLDAARAGPLPARPLRRGQDPAGGHRRGPRRERLVINEHDPGRRAELQAAVEAMPRVGLAALPTPFEPCPHLSKALGGPRIWIKRDDLTGLAAGGNKTRMFEFVLGKALEEGADTVVGGAAVQSNYCRQLAAACSRLGLECHLVLRKVRGERDREVQGGLLLDLLVGARVELVEDEGSWESLGARIREKGRQLTAAGRKVHVARVGDESGIGLSAVGYAAATLELLDQAEAAQVRIDEIWLCSTDSTQAGIALALKHLRSPIRLVGLPALPEPVTSGWTFEECLSSVANECGSIPRSGDHGRAVGDHQQGGLRRPRVRRPHRGGAGGDAAGRPARGRAPRSGVHLQGHGGPDRPRPAGARPGRAQRRLPAHRRPPRPLRVRRFPRPRRGPGIGLNRPFGGFGFSGGRGERKRNFPSRQRLA